MNHGQYVSVWKLFDYLLSRSYWLFDILFPSAQAPAQKAATAPDVKISLTSFAIDKVLHADDIQWRVPSGATPIYCVSGDSAVSLNFSCIDCNSTATNAALTKNTQNLTLTAGYPVIMLSRFPISKSLNGKSLRCNAYYYSGGKMKNSTSKPTKMNILYMERPEILNSKGQKAVDNKFYVTDSSDLVCHVDGNPAPNEYTWLYGSQLVGSTEKLKVDTSRLQQVLRCTANNGLLQNHLESLAVRVDKWGKNAMGSFLHKGKSYHGVSLFMFSSSEH